MYNMDEYGAAHVSALVSNYDFSNSRRNSCQFYLDHIVTCS